MSLDYTVSRDGSKLQDLAYGRIEKMAITQENNSYSLLIHDSSITVRLLLVNSKFLEVVQRYLVQCFLVCGIEEDPACN